MSKGPLKELTPPSGYYWRSFDWLQSFGDHHKQRKLYMPYAETKITSHRMPKHIDPSLHWRFIWEKQRTPPEQFVAVVPEARIMGQYGAVISPDNRLLWDVSIEFVPTPDWHSIFRQNTVPQINFKKGNIAALTSAGTYNYYHWMFDVIVRFYLLHWSGISIDRYVINHFNQFHYQAETLKLLGIPKEKLLDYESDFHFQVENLIITPPVGWTGTQPKWACDFLRKIFLPRRRQPTKRHRRIYISRSNAKFRNITNEIEVINELSKYGFKSVQLETLTVREQIEIFNSAEAVVSPHGAGMTNIVFSQPGTKIIELFSPKYVNPTYWVISNHVQLDYYYLIGEGEHPPEWEDVFLFKDPITVDIKKLQNIINCAGLD